MLQHYSSSVPVFQSSEYSNFTLIDGNRSLNDFKIKRIIKEIESGNDMLQYYPIQVRVVGEKLQILDGQHRFFICKKLKRTVHYIIVIEAKSMIDIAKINSNVEKWKATDYINCYITNGNKNYTILKEFTDKYKFNVSLAVTLLSSGVPHNGGGKASPMICFEDGSFVAKYIDESIILAEAVQLFSSNTYSRDRMFIIAVYKIMQAGLVKMQDIATAFNKNPEMLVRQLNQKEYVNNLERIYNVGKHKRVVIL